MRPIPTKKLNLLFFLISVTFLLSNKSRSQENNNLIFRINTDNIKWKISNYLVGMHSIYLSEPDAFYEYDNNSYEKWLRDTGINTMRFPGGTIVKSWDWEAPTGRNKEDPWWNDLQDIDSYSPPSNAYKSVAPAGESEDSKNWTSLDEYLQVVKKSGIRPLLGVNITSSYVFSNATEFNSLERSVDRAVRMVKHVREELQNSHIKATDTIFYYLGNEGGNGGWENDAKFFIEHAKAMKIEDPHILLMFNQNNLTASYLDQFLGYVDSSGDKAADYIDIAETHGKWPYGGNPTGYSKGTIDQWQNESPLQDKKHKIAVNSGGEKVREWRNLPSDLKSTIVSDGKTIGEKYPNLKFANNEYGLGSGNFEETDFDRYTKNLIILDMLQEHFIGNWFMSCYWSQLRNPEEGLKEFVFKNKTYNFNPMHFGFEMLAEAQGAEMIEMIEATNNSSVYGFTAKKNGEYLIYLLNKSNQDQSIELKFNGDTYSCISDPVLNGITLTNESGEYGSLISTYIEKNSNKKFSSVLPALTYTQYKLKDQNQTYNKESFKNLTDNNENYHDTVFTGDNCIEWEYTASRLNSSKAAFENGLLIRNGDGNLSATLPGGISSFEVDLSKAFNKSKEAKIEVFINDTSIGISEEVGNKSNENSYHFTIDNIQGYVNNKTFKLDIKAIDKPIVIDNIQWSNGGTLSNANSMSQERISNLKLFPSVIASGENINIRLELKAHENQTHLSLYALNGLTVINKMIYQKDNKINLSEKISLPTGVYAIKIRNGNTMRVGKFIIK